MNMLSKIGAVKPVLKSNTVVSKETFKNSNCLLTISVGQEVHEAEKFAATIDLVADTFATCVMLIDDTLQRHTMALQSKEDAAFFYEKSLRAGDAWLERNEKYFKQLKIPLKIIRWNKWLKHPHYEQKNRKVHLEINKDPLYKQAFERTVNEFLRRVYNRLLNQKPMNVDKDYVLCFDYLIEECTALCLWSELNCHFEVYPSQRNLAMEATHQRFVLLDHPNLLHPLSIKFKNRKQLKAQSFDFLKNDEILRQEEFYD